MLNLVFVFKKPFITEMREITIRPQTETMQDVSTVTRDGIEIVFHGIQVLSSVDVSQLLSLVKKFGSEFRRVLIYDRVSEDLRLFCANHTIDEVREGHFFSKVFIFHKYQRNVFINGFCLKRASILGALLFIVCILIFIDLD